MARRRHRRYHSRRGGVGHYLNKAIVPATFLGSFISQATAKDIAVSTVYPTLPAMEKGKFLLNSVAGRATGFNPFPQYGNNRMTINPAGVVNKFTGLGLGLIILSHVIPRGMGGKSIARKAGKGLLWGGIVGGLIDDPVPKQAGASFAQQQSYSDNLATASMNTSMIRGSL